jgi:hypothetical protein
MSLNWLGLVVEGILYGKGPHILSSLPRKTLPGALKIELNKSDQPISVV